MSTHRAFKLLGPDVPHHSLVRYPVKGASPLTVLILAVKPDGLCRLPCLFCQIGAARYFIYCQRLRRHSGRRRWVAVNALPRKRRAPNATARIQAQQADVIRSEANPHHTKARSPAAVFYFDDRGSGQERRRLRDARAAQTDVVRKRGLLELIAASIAAHQLHSQPHQVTRVDTGGHVRNHLERLCAGTPSFRPCCVHDDAMMPSRDNDQGARSWLALLAS